MEKLKQMYCAMGRNWKTTLSGVIILVSLLSMYKGLITGNEFTGIMGAVAGMGFLASRDSHKVEKNEQN